MKDDPIMIEVHWPNGSISKIGTWLLPGELVNNYENQKDIGWHTFFSLVQGAEKVVIRRGQPSPTGDVER